MPENPANGPEKSAKGPEKSWMETRRLSDVLIRVQLLGIQAIRLQPFPAKTNIFPFTTKTKIVLREEAQPRTGGIPATMTTLSSIRSNLPIGTPVPNPMTPNPSTKRPVGRPRCPVSPEEVRRLRSQGMKLRPIARELGIGKTTVARLLALGYDAARPHIVSQNHGNLSQNSRAEAPRAGAWSSGRGITGRVSENPDEGSRGTRPAIGFSPQMSGR